MAIKVTRDDSDPNDPKLNLVINNGDRQALNDAMAKTRFISEEAMLRYMLVAMLQTDGKRLYIKQNGELVSLRPSDDLINKDDEEEE